MTLDELKQQNRAAEAAGQDAQPVPDDETALQPDDQIPFEDTSAGEEEGDEPEGKAVPEWMQTGEQRPDGGKVPVGAHVAMRRELKGQLSERNSEIEQLRQEVQNLKTGQATVAPPPVATNAAPMPKAEDFYDQADPDAAYAGAMQRWIDKGVEQRLQAQLTNYQQQQTQQQQDTQLSQALDQHYDRAAQIVTEGLLTAEEYQNSDRYLRQSVESIAPGNGDAFVDALLGRLGEGSEKVVVSLARNPTYMARFQQSLKDDPSGIAAAGFLGELRGKFNGAGIRVSQAPRPGTQLQGDVSANGTSARRQYKAAHKSGNRQKAFDIYSAAKRKGVDVSDWK